MSFDPSSIIVNPKVVDLMQNARLNGKLKSLVPEHDNNCITEIHVSPSPIVINQKTDDQKIVERYDVFVKDLADEGFSLIIGNCRNIFKKILPLNMFLLSSNFPKIASIVQKLSPAFIEINNTIQSSESFFESSSYTLEMIVLLKLHPSFSQQYLPVRTSSDGNCLRHMLSIGLVGNQDLTVCLRLLTVEILATKKDIVQTLMRFDLQHRHQPCAQSDIEMLNYQVLEIARKWKAWGGEYHLLALGIALQRDIYIYSTFRIDGKTNMQSLKNVFDSASAETRGHLLYRSPQCFQSNRYSMCKPICGFFFFHLIIQRYYRRKETMFSLHLQLSYFSLSSHNISTATNQSIP
jgi:hypothetical protein